MIKISSIDLGFDAGEDVHVVRVVGVGDQQSHRVGQAGAQAARQGFGGIFGALLTGTLLLPILQYHGSTTFAIMGNLGWQNWSEFGEVGVSLANPAATSLEIDANFKDTWPYAIGARYRIDPQWSVSAGFAYDDSPVSNSNS